MTEQTRIHISFFYFAIMQPDKEVDADVCDQDYETYEAVQKCDSC